MNIVIVGTGGIGVFLAEKLRIIGHAVFCASRKASQNPYVNRGLHFDADVTSAKEIRDCVKYISVHRRGPGWKHVDAIIYTVGVHGQICPNADIDPEIFLRTYDTNVVGFLRVWLAFRGLLEKSPRAKVMMFGGGGADKSRPFFSAYAASKAAAVRLVENFSEESKNTGFKCDVNIIAPGVFLSSMTKEIIKAGSFIGDEFKNISKIKDDNEVRLKLLELVNFLLSTKGNGISGKFIASRWDPFEDKETYKQPGAYLLRRGVPTQPTSSIK